MSSKYYELRCAVVEMFYETQMEEGYTVGQAASRCLVEFRREALGGRQEGLTVLSVLLSRVARHEPEALANFGAEIAALKGLGKKFGCWRGLDSGEKERMREDVMFALEKAEQVGGG